MNIFSLKNANTNFKYTDWFKVSMGKIMLIIIIFLIVGAFMIIKQNNLDLDENSKDRISFAKKFSGWVFNVGKNIKELTGEATNQEWLPKENQDNDTIK